MPTYPRFSRAATMLCHVDTAHGAESDTTCPQAVAIRSQEAQVGKHVANMNSNLEHARFAQEFSSASLGFEGLAQALVV